MYFFIKIIGCHKRHMSDRFDTVSWGVQKESKASECRSVQFSIKRMAIFINSIFLEFVQYLGVYWIECKICSYVSLLSSSTPMDREKPFNLIVSVIHKIRKLYHEATWFGEFRINLPRINDTLPAFFAIVSDVAWTFVFYMILFEHHATAIFIFNNNTKTINGSQHFFATKVGFQDRCFNWSAIIFW